MDNLFLVGCIMLAVSLGGIFAGILWQKFRIHPPEITHISITDILPEGCLGEDGRLIPWRDIETIVKEQLDFPNYSAGGAFSVVRHFKIVYRIKSPRISSKSYYEICYLSKPEATTDVSELVSIRKEFNAKALSLFEHAKVFPNIGFESYGFLGREKNTVDQECDFLRHWQDLKSTKKMMRVGNYAKWYYMGIIFIVVLTIVASLVWLKR